MKFSIITPVYNRADCVARCIESVINQKRTLDNSWECEHIIVNDGSKDNTHDIVNDYSKKYSDIVYINFIQNKGTNAARNAAIKAATGDFCIILDSDDFFVEDALDTIYITMQNKPGFKHYMFTPDDRQEFFDNNEQLNKGQIIKYRDFLSQKYCGDFIHIIKREIMQKYPFDESLRIYEGVFFLKFYKEAQDICFTNVVVTIRERGREDSVTKEYIKTNKKIISNSIKAIRTQIEWYKEDYVKHNLKNQIQYLYTQLLDNYLLIGNYDESKEIFECAKSEGYTIPTRYKAIYSLRLSHIYRFMLYVYFKLKYDIIKRKVK